MGTAPIVIVVGFLGSGKTTFLRQILPQLEERGLDPYVIINDYSNARVDAVSLQQDGRVVTPINGNCICCDSLFELVSVLEKIELTENRVVLIEANGTTDPAVLIEHLLVKPELKSCLAPIIQVTIADVERWQQRGEHNALEKLQAETASHLQFTRIETCSPERITEVSSSINGFNPQARSIQPESFVEELVRLRQEAGVAPQAETAPATHHDHGHDHSHNHDHDHHHLSHAYVGMELNLPDPMPAQHLLSWLDTLPDRVLRVKGLVRFAEEPERWYHFQCADGTRDTFKSRELRTQPKVLACAVLIGVNLDEQAIRDSLTKPETQEVSNAS